MKFRGLEGTDKETQCMGVQKVWLGNSGRLPRGGDWDEGVGLVGAGMGRMVSDTVTVYLPAQLASGRAGQGSWQEASPCWL